MSSYITLLCSRKCKKVTMILPSPHTCRRAGTLLAYVSNRTYTVPVLLRVRYRSNSTPSTLRTLRCSRFQISFCCAGEVYTLYRGPRCASMKSSIASNVNRFQRIGHVILSPQSNDDVSHPVYLSWGQCCFVMLLFCVGCRPTIL